MMTDPIPGLIGPFVDLRPQDSKSLGSILPKVDDTPFSELPLPDSSTETFFLNKDKGFNDGPGIPGTSPSRTDNFGISFRTGVSFSYSDDIKDTTPEVIPSDAKKLQEFVTNLPSTGTQGLTINEGYQPDGGKYDEGVHFLLVESLGKGSFGKVDLGIDTSSKRKFVRKQIQKKMLRSSEVIVPLNVEHVNLTKVYGVIQRQRNQTIDCTVDLLLEFAGQSLNRWVQEKELTHDEIWQLTKQALSGLCQLDRYGMVHMDIKPENLCIQRLPNGTLVLKITDFGSAKLSNEGVTFVGNTPEYLAVEMCKLFLQLKHSNLGLNFGLDDSAVTGRVDVFALALSVMFMYKKYHILQKLITNGEVSYAKYDPQTRHAMQQQLMITMVQDHHLVENLIPDEVDLDMRDLLCRMVQYDYTERITAATALKFVEDRETRLVNARLQSIAIDQHNLAQRLQHQVIVQPEVNYDMNHVYTGDIPNMANCAADFESGPIRNSTKDRLRSKLGKHCIKGKSVKPYGKSVPEKGRKVQEDETEMSGRRYSRGKGKKMLGTEPMSELRNLERTVGVSETSVPMTPVEDMQRLVIGTPTQGSVQVSFKVVQPRGDPFLTSCDNPENYSMMPVPFLNVGLQTKKDCAGLDEQLMEEEDEFISITEGYSDGPQSLIQSSVQLREETGPPAGNIPNCLDW